VSVSSKPRMSRAVRSVRGLFGALTATMLAAASHSVAGGTATPLAIAATTFIALPVCVLLAGRIASLWRLALAVSTAQFLYHWAFAGLGSPSAGLTQAPGAPLPAVPALPAPVSPHAHLSLLRFDPELASAGTDASMWASHALAAALTIALMHWGERSLLHLVRVLRSALPTLLRSVRLPAPRVILALDLTRERVAEHNFLSVISHRGPPVCTGGPAACADH